MDKMENINNSIIVDIAKRIERLVTDARARVARTVNITEVITKYEIGRIIVDVVQNWSVRQLQRQYNSSLYERLALSRDKDANVYAQQYALYLPDKRTLQAKLKEWIDELD